MKKPKLTPAQRDVVDVLKMLGKPLHHVKGVYWTYEGCKELGAGYPLWHTSIQTLRALVKLGYVLLDESLPIYQRRAILNPELQKLVFLKEWVTNRGFGFPNKAKPVRVEKEPSRIVTLYAFDNEARPPQLPILPVHNAGAFFEDKNHDWQWVGGWLYYGSRVMDRPVWILLEYEP